MNLTIALLSTRQFLGKQRLRELVGGYHGLGDSAFNRQFERDKDELRAMGVPIVTGNNDPLFDDEIGYRIPRSAFELPTVSFDEEERSVLGLAASVWQQASAAGETVSALTTLRAAGVEPDVERLEALAPHIGAREPAFDVCWRATLDHTTLRFGYRGGQARTVQPWSVIYRRGSWYLLGHDVDRKAPRMFKMGRMDEVPVVVGAAGDYEVPPEVDPTTLARQLEPEEPDALARIAVRGARLPWVRRAGTPVGAGVALPEDFRCYEVPFSSDGSFAAELAAAGPDALVLSPQWLRAEVLRRLRAVAGEGS